MATSSAAREAGAHPAVHARALHQRTKHHRDHGLHGGALREALLADGFTPAEADRAAGLDVVPDDQATRDHQGDDDRGRGTDRPRSSHPAGSRAARPARVPRRRSYPRAFRGQSGTTSGVMLALIAYPLMLAVIKDGPPGAREWFESKFLNKTASGPAGVAPGTPARPTRKTPGVTGTPGTPGARTTTPQPGQPWYKYGGPGVGTGTGA